MPSDNDKNPADINVAGMEQGLTFDDVLLVPQYSSILPRKVDLSSHVTERISLNIPLLSAAMDTVTESPMAIALAQQGGLGVIHKNMSAGSQARQVRLVKKHESGVVKDPLTVSPGTCIGEVLELTRRYNISGLPVVDGDNLVGIVTSRDLRFEERLDDPVSNIMTGKDRLVTVGENEQRAKIKELLHEHRIEKLLVVNDKFELTGLITVKDIQKAQEFPHACKDGDGRLRVGAAVGVEAADMQRAHDLVNAGVDVLVVDTAHGNTKGVVNKVREIRREFGATVQILAGNIATADAAGRLAEAGADGVKVGIGPGSICTTRIISGVGVPQISAIINVADGLRRQGGQANGKRVALIADGGIRYSGDIAKAIAAGADAVMVGGLFAGTEESPGEVELYQGRSYKTYRGMGSLGAMAQQYSSRDRYLQGGTEPDKLVPEGVEGRVPYKGQMTSILHQILGGVRAAMGYVGCQDFTALRRQAKFIRLTNAGIRESHVHDVMITKEPPNYHIE